jgi:hypothetical protein
MATGDQSNITGRLQALSPNGWFSAGQVPLRDALLTGLANAHAFVYSLLAYITLQARILTASDSFLDLIAGDFFGNGLQRATNQSDSSYRAQILVNMFRERATRKGLIAMLTQLTGRAPLVIEVTRPADTGAYSAPNSGYGSAGAYGSLLLPNQAFVQAFRPLACGIPIIAGYGIPTAAYSTPSQGGEYASINSVVGAVSDAAIYAAIDSVKPAGSTLWTKINS